MLWDIIRDWFVEYIFGGRTSTNSYFQPNWGDLQRRTSNGFVYLGDESSSGDIAVNTGFLQFDYTGGESSSLNETLYLPVSDYLSTLATIITISVFVFILFSILWWLFKEIRNTLSFR